jgi:lactoylglutathione lyase
MNIEHIAIWVKDLEESKAFYSKYFNATAGEKYHNPQKKFTSYFLSFETGARLELMHKPLISIGKNPHSETEKLGLIHFAMSVGSKDKVDQLTESIRQDGYQVIGEPRTTGDGYYESVIQDPEGNRIEVTV